MILIVMTAQQAVDIAGFNTPDSQLKPIVLADGKTFILGLEVLDDPAHADKRDMLMTFTQREVAPEEFVQSEII